MRYDTPPNNRALRKPWLGDVKLGTGGVARSERQPRLRSCFWLAWLLAHLAVSFYVSAIDIDITKIWDPSVGSLRYLCASTGCVGALCSRHASILCRFLGSSMLAMHDYPPCCCFPIHDDCHNLLHFLRVYRVTRIPKRYSALLWMRSHRLEMNRSRFIVMTTSSHLRAWNRSGITT